MLVAFRLGHDGTDTDRRGEMMREHDGRSKKEERKRARNQCFALQSHLVIMLGSRLWLPKLVSPSFLSSAGGVQSPVG